MVNWWGQRTVHGAPVEAVLRGTARARRPV